MTARTALTEHIAGLELVDNHVHGFWLTSADRRRFENGLNEANTEALADFDSGFDTQLGFAVRAHCAPLLGLAPHADPQTYWEARAGHAETELAGIFLPAAGVSDWLIDTGLKDLAGLTDIADAGRGRVHEVTPWNWPRSARSSIPQTLLARRSCTISEHAFGAMEPPTCSPISSTAASGASRMPAGSPD